MQLRLNYVNSIENYKYEAYDFSKEVIGEFGYAKLHNHRKACI